VLQNDPVPKGALEDHLRSLVGSEGEKVANICRLIHTKSGLLSESPVCADRDYVLEMARTIVSSHRAEQSEAQGSEPFDEEMYLGLVQNEGERVAEISRQIYDACALSGNVDWCLLVDNARWIISPYCGVESEAQANIVIGSRGVRLKED
jgi:hypothetical protein